MVVRKLDFKRTESQNAILEGHVTPSAGDDSVSDVVDDVIPEEIRPDRVQGASDDAGGAPDPDEIADDLEDDLDLDAGGSPTAAATDGGEIDE